MHPSLKIGITRLMKGPMAPMIRKIARFSLRDSVQAAEERIMLNVFPEVAKRISQSQEPKQAMGSTYPAHDPSHPTPSWGGLMSQACTVEQCQDPRYFYWCDELKMTPILHRKRWEYAFILEAINRLTAFRSDIRGLGFGVGKEPIVPYLAGKGLRLTATDLAPTEAVAKGWADTNQFAFRLEDYFGFGYCSMEVLKERVQTRTVDMNQVPDDLRRAEFDFAWSACALEHLGNIDLGLEFIRKSLECVRPGGFVVHTTELNIGSLDQTLTEGPSVLFLKKHIESLAEELRSQGHELELNFNLGHQWSDLYFDVPPYSEYSHLKLELEKHVTTSFGLIIKKGHRQ